MYVETVQQEKLINWMLNIKKRQAGERSGLEKMMWGRGDSWHPVRGRPGGARE